MSGGREVDAAKEVDAVVTHGLCKRYGGELALDHVELRVPEGSVYVLAGANGAGKSTALKVLLNLVRADGGTAQVYGRDTVRDGAEVRAQIGYVPEQSDVAYGWMTCDRLLQHVAAFYPGWHASYAAHLCRALGLRLERRCGGMSKGERRRLQLVVAMAHRPPLLLLDEPTDGLDPVVRRRTLELLTEHLTDTPATVLLSTHQIHEVESLADHVGVLREGRLVAQMPRDELLRTVRRYRFEVPDGWAAPPALDIAGVRRSAGGRVMQWTLVGEEVQVTQRLVGSGARVQEVMPLALEDAVLGLLTSEVSR